MKFTRRARERQNTNAIDITPMMDAAFILIIFLLISTAFKKKEHAFEIELPKATEQEVVVQKGGISVFLTKSGKLFSSRTGDSESNKEPVKSPEALAQSLKQDVLQEPEIPINLVIDQGTSYDKIVIVINALRGIGVTNLQLPYETQTHDPE